MQEIETESDKQQENNPLLEPFAPVLKTKVDYMQKIDLPFTDVFWAQEPDEYEELCVDSQIVLERPITGNFITRFVHRIAKNLTRFYVKPVFEDQNRYNDQMLYAINLLRIGQAELAKDQYYSKKEQYTLKKDQFSMQKEQYRILEQQQTGIEDNELTALSQYVYRDLDKKNKLLEKQCDALVIENTLLKEKVQNIENRLNKQER